MFTYQELGPVLDKLAATVLPEDFPNTKQSDSKPKVILCLLDTLRTYMNTQMQSYKSYISPGTMGLLVTFPSICFKKCHK